MWADGIHIELDVYAQAHDREGHAFQLECLKLKSGMGSKTLYIYIAL